MSDSTNLTRSKFAAPSFATLVLNDWAPELAKALNCSEAAVLSGQTFIATVPLGTVKINLMDDSNVKFRHALFLVNEERRAIAVFTEHCGNHVFPFHESKVYVDGQLRYEQNPSCLPTVPSLSLG
jgi:hypothetical protein